MELERMQFTFYGSFFRAIRRIRKKADRADAYDAICAYALHGEEPDMSALSDAASIAFELIRPNLDASRRKAENEHEYEYEYEYKCKERKKKRARPPGGLRPPLLSRSETIVLNEETGWIPGRFLISMPQRGGLWAKTA